MKKLLLAIGLLYTISHATQPAAGTNQYLLKQSNKIHVEWRAYKTFAKIGVGGTFTAVNYTPAKLEGNNFKELLVGSKVQIETTTVNTDDPQRDKTLVTFFFHQLSKTTIDGVIKDIHADPYVKGKPRTGIINVMFTMNEKSLVIPMQYQYDIDRFSAQGTIDIADFNALPALASINKNCYDLHEGKTWRDVTISFSTTIKASLPDDSAAK